MKLIVAIVQADDAAELLDHLAQRGFGATRVKTVGGFLREVNATILLGVEAEQVETVLQITREHCQPRWRPNTAIVGAKGGSFLPENVEVGGATIFVLDVGRFEKL